MVVEALLQAKVVLQVEDVDQTVSAGRGQKLHTWRHQVFIIITLTIIRSSSSYGLHHHHHTIFITTPSSRQEAPLYQRVREGEEPRQEAHLYQRVREGEEPRQEAHLYQRVRERGRSLGRKLTCISR